MMRSGTHYRKKAKKRQLTNREKQVASLIACDGFTTSDIAGILKISPRTVYTHVNNVLTKLNLSNRVSLGVYWRENELEALRA